MNAIRMTFRAAEEYQARLSRAKKEEDLRKCRCWFDCRDEAVTVTLDEQGIALEYGRKNARSPWTDVISVTEIRDGLLIRLNGRRLLLLPAGADDEALIAAGILLGQRCKATFRAARTRLRGVGLGRMLDYHTRPGQWFSFGRQMVRRILLVFLCIGIVAGTLLTLAPFTWNRQISRAEAVEKTAVFERFEVDYRYRLSYSQVRGISVELAELGVREVDSNCPLAAVRENLSRAEPGDTMTLLLHPENGEVLAMETEDAVLLSYDDYVKYHRRHNVFNVIFGLIFYAGTGGLAWELKKQT